MDLFAESLFFTLEIVIVSLYLICRFIPAEDIAEG